MHFSALFTHCPVCGSERFVQHNVKSKHCEDCGFVYYVNPSAAVASFIVNAKGDLLVCKRGKEPVKGTLDLPGGFVDEHETAEEAIRREINEELQAKVFSARFLFTLPNEYEYGGMTIPTLDIFYECSLESNENLKPSDDVADCFFVPVKELNPELFGLNSIRKAVGMFIVSHK
jgi:ADP-ribose pyrophosphatase YjhB (NUDIX family)